MPIEFAAWTTPFANADDVRILQLVYDIQVASLDNGHRHECLHVAVQVMGNDDQYVIHADCHTYRQINEYGLLALWGASKRTPRPAGTTFRARNHEWGRESFLSFELETVDGWSYFIASETNCIEMLCRSRPRVEKRP